jgi:S-formylglutathione hydrolase FrmB
MGGYGALKIAMAYDTLFQSVSAMSPFTSFESFLTDEVIAKVFEENGIADDDFSYSSYKTINIWSDSLHPDKTYSQLVLSMAAAFSPHDPGDPDSTNFFALAVVGGKDYGADLPFDSTRSIPPGSSIWDRWLFHDIKNRLIADPAGLGDLYMYLDCGDQDQFNLSSGVRTFSQLLSLYGKEHTYIEYGGYAGYPADHDNFIYDRLPEILKFHSQHFGEPQWKWE